MREYIYRIRRTPYISITLVVINAVIFLLCTFTGNLLYNIGTFAPYTFLGGREYYRIISAMFLHADINHLVNNMLLLFGLGAMLEEEMGHAWFLALYFISGIGGQFASLIYKLQQGEWLVGSIGASGAVFGLVGVLLAFVLFSKDSFPNITLKRVLFVIAFTVYSGMRAANIDNAAHIGGCITGFVAGCIYSGCARRVRR